jgi:crotonobetainyl-CoA:carnitine CoA-transferase CaiB-like acyl-CoA transferase
MVKTTLLPITLEGRRPGVRLEPPAMGEHTRELLTAVGYAREEIDELFEKGVVA